MQSIDKKRAMDKFPIALFLSGYEAQLIDLWNYDLLSPVAGLLYIDSRLKIS